MYERETGTESGGGGGGGAGYVFSLPFAYWLVAYKWERLITMKSVSASIEFQNYM